VDPDITLAAYAERWLALIAATVKPRTVESHEGALRCHILLALGKTKVRQLFKGQTKTFLARRLVDRCSIMKVAERPSREVRSPLEERASGETFNSR
jgi:hypothetical protein